MGRKGTNTRCYFYRTEDWPYGSGVEAAVRPSFLDF